VGYLEYDRYEIIFMTEKRKGNGAYLIFRHETAERFLQWIGCKNPLEEAGSLSIISVTIPSETWTLC
jgi:Mn-dependent DtxR family transcriptional regulator